MRQVFFLKRRLLVDVGVFIAQFFSTLLWHLIVLRLSHLMIYDGGCRAPTIRVASVQSYNWSWLLLVQWYVIRTTAL